MRLVGASSTKHPVSTALTTKATPLAKKIAAQNNIDLAGISGSGPDGRIIKDDLSG